MEKQTKLFNDPAFEKTSVIIYLDNNLSLNQLLTIENLVRTNKLNKVLRSHCNSEQLNNSDGVGEHSTEHTPCRRIRYKQEL